MSGTGVVDGGPDPALRRRIEALCEEGWERWERFDREVRQHEFHPFVAADYDRVVEALIPLSRPGRRFLEWGSATGVITILADMLGYDACGIELDEPLVREARALASRVGSNARFAAGSFLPEGYRTGRRPADGRLGTIGQGPSGYLELGIPLGDFEVVFGYPWPGEEPIMLDVMDQYGSRDALLLLHGTKGVVRYRDGRELP